MGTTIGMLLFNSNTARIALADGSVHCVITSPPYLSHRDYGLEPVIWGGRADCDHVWKLEELEMEVGKGNWAQAVNGRGEVQGDVADFREPIRSKAIQGFCTKCSAWQGNLGQEPTPGLFIEHLVIAFREVWRVLRPDGTCWIVIGDTFARNPSRGVKFEAGESTYIDNRQAAEGLRGARVPEGMQEKDLIGIPWMLAFALRADGWLVRCAPPWLKRNSMPDSTADRPGISHETILLLTKGPRYFYDREAVKLPATSESIARAGRAHRAKVRHKKQGGPKDYGTTGVARHRSAAQALDNFAGIVHKQDGTGNPTYTGFNARWREKPSAGRNRRTSDWGFESFDRLVAEVEAWLEHARRLRAEGGMLCDFEGDPVAFLVNPRGYKGEHYATYPPELVEPMIAASTSECGCCPMCGAQWERMTEDGPIYNRADNPNDVLPYEAGSGMHHGTGATTLHKVREVETIGWRPGCTCNVEGLIYEADDLEIIATPTGEGNGDDPTKKKGRRGLGRPRNPDEGVRPITRYEQRRYAAQLRASPHRDEMATEASKAFEHYIRTDRTGARPLPSDLLERWISRGWISRVAMPAFTPFEPIPAIVFDPFVGSGTTIHKARQMGRRGVGADLSFAYLHDQASERLDLEPLRRWQQGKPKPGADALDGLPLFANADEGA